MAESGLRIVANLPVGTRESLEVTFRHFLRIDCAAGDAAADTLRGYMTACRVWLSWCRLKGVDSSTATEEDVRSYRRHLVDVGFAAGTIAHRLKILRRFFAALAWRGIRKDNPAEGIKPPRERYAPEERIKFLQEQVLVRLFKAIPDGTLSGFRDRAMIALMALHGLRGVEVHRADLQDLELTTDPAKLLVHGKTGERVVYLRRDVAATLRRYLAARIQEELSTGQTDPLFVSLSNRAMGKRISRRGIRTVTDGYLKVVGCRHTGTHVLRHTAATLSRIKGAETHQIQAMLGHRDSRTTEVYAHVVDRIQNNPANKIEIEI